jgi:translation initiation factor 1
MGRKNKQGRDADDTDSGFAALNPFDALDLDLPPGPADEPPPPAADPLAGARLHVHFERKGRGGKTVTIVDGFPAAASAADLERLARELRQALATGGTVRETTIELQGDVVTRATAWLREHGYA